MTEEVFLVKLARGLEFYKSNLEKTALPKLKQAASVLHSSFKNIYQVCVESKVLNEDQYESEISVVDLKTPSILPFTETEKKIEMSIRIAAYGKQLNYLNTSFSFNIDNLNLINLKKLSDLSTYIDWTSFSENSGKIITRTLATMVGSLKLSSDQMQGKVIKNDLKRLREESTNFKEALQAILFFRVEQYKAELRKRISFAGVIDFNEDTNEDIEKNIRHLMNREMTGVPYYSNLVEQLISEEKKAPNSWEDLLKKISPEEKKTVSTKSLDKNELLKIVQELGKSSLVLNKILKKFDENSIVMNRKKRNFFEKISYMLSEAFNKNKKIIYDIKVQNEANTVKKSVTLNYLTFSEELKDKAHKIYLLSTSENLKSLGEMDDAEILIKINTSLDVFKRNYRTLSALDTFFKEESPKNVKSDISGVMVELNSIKTSLYNTQKKKNEYISQKEEIDQLKKLGIEINHS